MNIEHIAIWTHDIEVLRSFYCTYFSCIASERYENRARGFVSYFLKFPAGARLEIMQKTGVDKRALSEVCGLAHFAISVGSEDAVRLFTERLRSHGVPVRSEPRWTGDGYYESVVADPDENLIEITI